MKKSLLCFVLIICSTGIYAQKKTGLSATTRNYLDFKSKAPLSYPEGFVYKNRNDGIIMLSALIKVSKDIDENILTARGIQIGTKAGLIWTVRIPENQVLPFTKLSGILYIQLDEPLVANLDEVRKQTRVDSVQKGIGLPAGFNGNNVVVGIMDIGFDYTHPSFFDTTGNKYRIKRIWEQKSIGTPPSGFGYGNEITDSLLMWSKGTDNNTQSHGSHVTGIAAGSGFGSNFANSRYRGIAYKSDIVLVGITPAQSQWENTGMADIIDGINYIFTYAQSLGKPAVANLSWGCTIGPHDGTSLFSQACDNLTGKGKIFVCAAGNTGDINLHLNKTFTPIDTTVSTVVTFQSGMTPQKTWVDIWGDTSKTFCVKVTLYNGSIAGSTSGFVCIDDNMHSFNLKGSNGDTCFITMNTSSSEFNMRTHILLNIYSRVYDKIVITLNAKQGKINMWNGYVLNSTGYYGAFTNGGFAWASAGNTNTTISDMGSTKSAITIGAYASKISFTNVSGSTLGYSSYVAKGNITPFSSHGPTVDNRIKPDIAAPGMTIASSVNSYDASFKSAGTNYPYVVYNYYKSQNSKTYSYAMMSGTSMASPVVTGITALLLEADPFLDPQTIKSIYNQNAIKDAYTGSIPIGGSNIWGGGKINAYGSIKNHLLSINVLSVKGNIPECKVYPNPGTGRFLIAFLNEGNNAVMIEVFNSMGQSLRTENAFAISGSNQLNIDLSGMNSGVYFIRLSSKEKTAMIKTVLQ